MNEQGLKLQAAREALGLTRRMVAERVGVSIGSIARLERGEKAVCITESEQIDLAQTYGVRVAALSHCEVREKMPRKSRNGSEATDNLESGAAPSADNPIDNPFDNAKKKERLMFDRVVLSRDELKMLNLPANPFPDRPRSGGLFMYPELAKVLQAAEDAAQDSQMLAIIGPSGSGKSSLLCQIKENLEKWGNVLIVDLAVADRSRLTDRDIECALLEAMKEPRKSLKLLSPRERLQLVATRLSARARANQRVVILGDDFHDASESVLRVLRRVREADARYYLFGAVLMGQPGLGGALESDELIEVRGRTDILNMPVLGGYLDRDRKEAQNWGHAFLDWHFKQIGVDISRYFTPEASHAIAEAAQHPLWVRNYASRALQFVAPLGKPVDRAILAKLHRRPL